MMAEDFAPRSRWRRGSAVLLPVIALLAELALRQRFQPSIWFLFYPAVFFSSWLGGLRAALAASVISIFCAIWFLIPPEHTLEATSGQWFAAFVLLACGAAFGFVHDRLRSAHRRTADALAASERATKHLASFVELAPDGIFVADLDGRYTAVNDAGCRMLGYAREEIIGKSILDVVPAGLDKRLAREKQLMLRGRPWVSEWTLYRKDGTSFPAEVSARILDDGRWQAFVRDISRRKRQEQALRDAQERFELALAGADLATWDWNIESGDVVFNRRWGEMRGLRPDEIPTRGDGVIDTMHPEDFPHVRDLLDDYLHGRRSSYEVEHRVRTKSGHWIWVLGRGKVFARNQRGEPTRMVGTELDITFRKRAEQELRAAEANAQFLSEVGSVLASSLDLDSTMKSIGELATRSLAEFCIVYLTGENGERRFHCVSRDPAHAWICDALKRAPIDRPRSRVIWADLEANRAVLLAHVSHESLAALARSDEHLRALHALEPRSLVIAPLFAHGKLLGALELFSTLPDRVYGAAEVRLAEQLAQRAAYALDNAQLYAAARDAIHTRDSVLGIVAHDLRNPLGSVQLQAAMLRQPGVEPDQRSAKVAESIERSARRMNRLIQDLLDVARSEQDRLSVETARLSADKVIADSVEGQAPLTEAAGLSLLRDAAHDLPELCADRDRLMQIFENLIGNAIKFSHTGGTITIGATPRVGEVLFWVADTGTGIAPSDVPHVFDRFWQAQAGAHGAGLGLPIVKGLVEAHGGRVWVESTPGRGSIFFFTIPTAPHAGAARSHVQHH